MLNYNSMVISIISADASNVTSSLNDCNSWLIGILSGIISSLIFFLIFFLIKPRIKISERICKEKGSNNEDLYRIKIVNKTFSMLVNMEYFLYYKTIHSDGIDSIEEIKPCKPKLKCIPKFCFKKNEDYAVRISYSINSKERPIDNTHHLVFRIVASHQITGTIKADSVEYSEEKIQEGQFETGESTKIINYRHTN